MQEYWVVGGNFSDVSFAVMSEGSSELFGPFASYADAFKRWRDCTASTRSKALTRYSILVTAEDRNEAVAA